MLLCRYHQLRTGLSRPPGPSRLYVVYLGASLMNRLQDPISSARLISYDYITYVLFHKIYSNLQSTYLLMIMGLPLRIHECRQSLGIEPTLFGGHLLV